MENKTLDTSAVFYYNIFCIYNDSQTITGVFCHEIERSGYYHTLFEGTERRHHFRISRRLRSGYLRRSVQGRQYPPRSDCARTGRLARRGRLRARQRKGGRVPRNFGSGRDQSRDGHRHRVHGQHPPRRHYGQRHSRKSGARQFSGSGHRGHYHARDQT